MMCGSPLWEGNGRRASTNEMVDMGVIALSEMGIIIHYRSVNRSKGLRVRVGHVCFFA